MIAPGSPDARRLLARAEAARDALHVGADELARREAAVRAAVDRLRAGRVAAALAAMPVDRLRDVGGAALRLAPLEDAGYRTVADVRTASVGALDAIDGVGAATATQAKAAAEQLAGAIADAEPVRLDPDARDEASSELLRALDTLARAQAQVRSVRGDLGRVVAALDDLVPAARPARGRLRFFFTRSAVKARARDALDGLAALVDEPETRRVVDVVASADRAALRPVSRTDAELWSDYEQHAATWQTLLAAIAAAPVDEHAVYGFSTAEVIDTVNRLRLDVSLLEVSLRGYQEFGAKFALVQRRALLGDEMGLGKTVQAIAALAHLHANGATHSFVVCPASVIVNWANEIERHSRLDAVMVHGADRHDELARWSAHGGVGVATYDTVRGLAGSPAPSPAMLVVDEAHYVKNADAQRSIAVARWIDQCDRVLLMTGTPMENRLDEFRTLVRYVRPDLALEVDPARAAAGAVAFRRAVGPVYLRRNQEDVLPELPQRLDVEDWVALGPDDRRAYERAVVSGNFMAMRRAVTVGDGGAVSAKLERLDDLVAEAAAEGRKTVVFSFFLEVLARALDVAGKTVPTFGPIDGSVAPAERQRLVDAFSAHEGAAVLGAQIVAGGVGLNIQAASVVILLEPQWKPSSEEQAIGRVQRMGQARRVNVHRLLAKDTVDELLLDVVRGKSALFDDYARPSDLKEATPSAVAVGEATVARRIVAAERERLGLPGGYSSVT